MIDGVNARVRYYVEFPFPDTNTSWVIVQQSTHEWLFPYLPTRCSLVRSSNEEYADCQKQISFCNRDAIVQKYPLTVFTVFTHSRCILSQSVSALQLCLLPSFIRSFVRSVGCSVDSQSHSHSHSLTRTHTHRHKDYGSLNDKPLSLFAYPLYVPNIGFKAIVGLGLWLFGDTIPRKSQKKIYIM